MKQRITSLLLAILTFHVWAPTAKAAGIEPLGRVELFGGAEKEAGTSAGGRGGLELLGIIPLTQNLGLQSVGHYVGGRGSRFGLSAGPVYDFGSAKAGFFTAYQYRSHNDNHFVHLRPSVTFYMPHANVNLFYSHPVSSAQRSGGSVERGINHLQATFNYFPAADLASFMRKDNVELTLGLQANSFAGAGSGKIPNGVGPVFGFSFMPVQNFEVNLVKGTVDHHGRYRVGIGVSYNFSKDAPTLKTIRSRYLEPNFFSPNGAATTGGGCPAPAHNLGGCSSPG
jgi:hypothetical protein